MRVTKFIIEDVRCFKGRHEFDIKPLTFITGGNSNGKSTILGCWQVMANWITRERLDFNKPPYLMGSFDNIVRRSRPKLTQFAIGFEMALGVENATHQVMVFFKKQANGSEPETAKVQYTLDYKGKTESVTITHLNGEIRHSFSLFWWGFYDWSGKKDEDSKEFVALAKSVYEAPAYKRALQEMPLLDDDSVRFLLDRTKRLLETATSIAPIRSAPQRTYDPVTGAEPSQGDDIPMLLRNLLRSPRRWKRVREQLNKFGEESGMFTDISVRKFEDSDSNPFQIEIKAVNSPKTNLIDVGYGTSQILPILVRVISEIRHVSTFLMQQPEVHLHPKGQATLTSFLVSILGGNPESLFLVETHSDHMIDRARIAVMRKALKREDLSIIYLESTPNKGVQVANLTVDAQGNLQNVPDGYRDFFLDETNKLLGF